jgi:hypothetical protein
MTSAASLSPDGTTSVLLFDEICRLLTQPSAFNLSLPEQFRTTAFCYLEGDAYTIAHMFDRIHLVKTMGAHGISPPKSPACPALSREDYDTCNTAASMTGKSSITFHLPSEN